MTFKGLFKPLFQIYLSCSGNGDGSSSGGGGSGGGGDDCGGCGGGGVIRCANLISDPFVF